MKKYKITIATYYGTKEIVIYAYNESQAINTIYSLKPDANIIKINEYDIEQ
jgi:hypothetical protein